MQGDENISFDEDKDLSGKICTLTAISMELSLKVII